MFNIYQYCYSLEEIDFAEGLSEIGANAFSGCYNLKQLNLPTSLRRIDNYAFYGCRRLKEVHVPSMITEIGDYAFKDCGLKAVYAYTISPVQINQNTFDYTGVDLYAPDNSFYAYYLNTQWSQFLDVKEFPAVYTNWYTPRNTDVTINVIAPIRGNADGDMEPGSGLIILGNGEQLVKGLILNWQHGANPFDVQLEDINFDGKWVWRYYDGQARAENGSGGWKDVTGSTLYANVGYIFQCNTAGDL